MLKDTDRYKQTAQAHFTNGDYKRKPKRSYKDITVFISVFFIGLLMILGFAKILSPNVDVEIADNDEYSDFADELPAGSVDERLKKMKVWLLMIKCSLRNWMKRLSYLLNQRKQPEK